MEGGGEVDEEVEMIVKSEWKSGSNQFSVTCVACVLCATLLVQCGVEVPCRRKVRDVLRFAMLHCCIQSVTTMARILKARQFVGRQWTLGTGIKERVRLRKIDAFAIQSTSCEGRVWMDDHDQISSTEAAW